MGSHSSRIDIECVAYVVEGERPAAVTVPNPNLGTPAEDEMVTRGIPRRIRKAANSVPENREPEGPLADEPTQRIIELRGRRYHGSVSGFLPCCPITRHGEGFPKTMCSGSTIPGPRKSCEWCILTGDACLQYRLQRNIPMGESSGTTPILMPGTLRQPGGNRQ